jgi:hypothetical protein
MKLTQKTIFQCFDKSQRQSPIILDDKDEGIIKTSSKFETIYKQINLLLDIIECELEIKPSIEQQEIHSHPPDFLLPIHIRQEDKSSQNDIIPLLNQWKLIESNDEILSDHLQNFDRICPTIKNNETNSPKIQVYHLIIIFSLR